MYLKSLIMIALITALYACPFTHELVSEYFANNYAKGLEEGKEENTVFDEGTSEVAYSAQESTSEDSIPDISDRSVVLNTAESSSVEIMDGAEDIVTVGESDISEAVQGKNDITEGYGTNTAVGDNDINEAKSASNVTDVNDYDSNVAGNTNDNIMSDNSYASSMAGNSNANPDPGNISTTPGQSADSKTSTAPGQSAESKTSTAPNQSAGSNTSATSSQPAANNINSGNNSSGSSGSATGGGTEYGETYRHNTSVYEDNSLIRVEYYDDDNNLYEYSDVTDYSADTGSYTETVYRYDEENNVEVPVRKDTYVDGVLVSSEYY